MHDRTPSLTAAGLISTFWPSDPSNHFHTSVQQNGPRLTSKTRERQWPYLLWRSLIGGNTSTCSAHSFHLGVSFHHAPKEVHGTSTAVPMQSIVFPRWHAKLYAVSNRPRGQSSEPLMATLMKLMWRSHGTSNLPKNSVNVSTLGLTIEVRVERRSTALLRVAPGWHYSDLSILTLPRVRRSASPKEEGRHRSSSFESAMQWRVRWALWS